MKIASLAFLFPLSVALAASAYEPTSHYTVRDMSGWKVYVNNGLLGDGQHAEIGARAVEKMEEDLAVIKTWVADRPLAELLKAPIWLEVDTTNGPHGRTPTFHYHPGLDWLNEMDFHPDKHKCVEFSRAESYVRSNRGIWIMMHELAHAYHDRVLGFDDPEIIAAHEKAIAGGKYPPNDWVIRANYKEYFAGVCTRYFESAEARKLAEERDPDVFKILVRVWEEPKPNAGKVPEKPQEPEKPEEPDEKRAFEPTSNYKVRNIEGWKVYVHHELLEGEKEVGDAALKRLQRMLEDIDRLLPERASEEMKKTAVWLETDNDWHTPCACYHGSEQWLRGAGLNPEKAKGVELSNAARFLRWSEAQPSVMLHEMTHAYQDRVLRQDEALFGRLKEAHQAAVASGKYDSVMRYHGRQQRHYAANNVAEYFAEATEAYFGVNDYYPFIRAELMHHDPAAYALMEEIWKAEPREPVDYGKNRLEVTEVPQAVRESLGLDPFYRKYVSARGFPVIASEKVSDYALLEAAYLINHMLLDRPDVRNALIESKVRFVAMASTEWTTDVPEHSDLEPGKFWDKRARGLGPTSIRPAVSCGEENLLRYPGDPYHEESILVHEFAHAIHEMGLASIDKGFNEKLKALYDQAMEKGLWKDKYAANNPSEYWAEGVQSFFDTNRLPDHDHNHVDTREELFEYDPELAELIAREFRNTRWRYVRPDARDDTGHLSGYDPAKAPTFAWPAELVEWYREYEAEQKAKREREGEKSEPGRAKEAGGKE